MNKLVIWKTFMVPASVIFYVWFIYVSMCGSLISRCFLIQ